MKDYILDLDKPRKLRFGFRAQKTIADKFEDDSLEVLLKVKLHEWPVIILAGLKWEDPDLDIEKATDLLDAAIPDKYDILELTFFVLEAYAAHMGIDVETFKKTVATIKKEEAEKGKEDPEKKDLASDQTSGKEKKPRKKPNRVTASTKNQKQQR